LSGPGGPPAILTVMSRDNVELVQRSYVLLEELREAKPGALERSFRECFDERVEVCIPDAYPEGEQVFRGRSGLRRGVESTREVWDEWRFEREQFLDAGDQVVVLVRVVARGGSSGISLDRETAHLWTVRDGRVTRCEVYLDRSEALEVARASGATMTVVPVARG
jgi:ketosteroid isomerase-like protein